MERGGDQLVLEDEGEPCREEDECRESYYSNGCVEDEENLGGRECNTPQEHGLGKTENKCQILETVDVVSTFGEVDGLRKVGQMM